MLGPFQDVLSRAGFQLEHPNITALYEALVLKGDFDLSESLLQSIAASNLFSSSIRAAQPYSSWTRLHAVDADGDAPSARGGHAMCIDPEHGMIYLFGGWDGQKSLDDFWVYSIESEKWELLSYATQRELHGPGPRACHKTVFDSKTGDIYFFGKLDDPGTLVKETPDMPQASEAAEPSESPILPTNLTRRPPAAGLSRTLPPPPWSIHAAELYRYHTRGRDAGKWDLLTNDTAVSNRLPI